MISSISCSQWPLPRVLAGAGASSSLRATAVLSLSPSRREATRPLTGGIGRKCDPVLMEKKKLAKAESQLWGTTWVLMVLWT